MFRMLVISMILFLYGLHTYARNEDFYFEHLEVKDGLSQQTVTAIFQDSEGYMWFGTRNGLNRYDGYEFKKYRKDYEDINSLADNNVQNISQDRSGNIWVATARGVNRIDGCTGQLKRYAFREYVNMLFYDSQNRLLVSTTKQNYLYDQQSDTFRTLSLTGNTLPGNVLSILEDREGNLYFGTYGQGIFVYDKELHFMYRLYSGGKEGMKLPGGYASYMLEGKDDRIWIILGEKHLCYYDRRKGEVKSVETITNVRRIIDWNEQYWLVGTFQGLVLLHKQTLQPEEIDLEIGNRGGLSHYSVISLFKDKEENLWVGTYAGGINYYNRHNYRFHYVNPAEFSGIIGIGAEGKEGTIWFATEGGGLLSYDPHTHVQKNYWVHDKKASGYNRNIIKSILLEGDHLYCATHGSEIYRFSLSEKRFHLMYDFGHGDICTLFRDSQGRLWIPTNTKRGLVVMDGERQVERLNLKKKYPELGVIVSILETSEKVFVIGTRTYGVYVYDENRDTLTRLSGKDLGLENAYFLEVTSMLKDGEGNVWVATNGAGVFVFDPQMKLKRRYARSDGLWDECVYGLTEYKESMWFMTSREFYRLDRKQGKWKRFSEQEGVMPAEFTVGAMFSGKDGKIYLPGTTGFMVVDPEVLTGNEVKPSVLLTDLKIDNEVCLPAAKGSPLKEKLQLQRKIVLKYNQTNLSIGYTALSYLYPHQSQYAFRMKGLEEKWNYVGNRREAYYNNLQPGHYVFQVVASNNDNVWNHSASELEIIVLSPFWIRWWACLLYLGLLGAIIYWIVRARHRKHELERSLHLKQLEQNKLQEMADERARFFTCVTHEFRTPLTLIINPLNDLLQKYVHVAGVKDSLLLVRRNAERLLSLVNSLMDFEKQQAGKIQFRPVCFDFAAFVHDIEDSFVSIADSRHILFHTEVFPGYIPSFYDKEKTEQVFFNVLSNAFKFTPEEGQVDWHTELVERSKVVELAQGRELKNNARQWLWSRVRDNGVGIDPALTEKVFEPFFQGKNDLHGKIAGSGIGLGMARSLAEQQGGLMFICIPDDGKGTEICILLPYIEASEEEMQESWLVENRENDKPANRQNPLTETELKATVSEYKVLLVEDNPEALDYLRKQLSGEYIVLVAGNGREAWEILEKQLPDMIISDVMMPEMDGIELCTKVKQDIRFSHIPVILLTAKTMSGQIEEGFKAGADDYIPKPFSISLLKIRVKNIFAAREQMKQTFGKKLSLKNLGFEVDKSNQDFMERYVSIVKANFRNQELDVDMICREMQMSRANFYKKLKTITDLAPVELIRNIRLETAASLLRETRMTISEVAVKVGFNSNSYFGSCFKALYGMSPKEYQNSKDTE